MAALIAFVQNDIKKVLAYSTMSQLAYIFTGLGVVLWFYNTDHHHAAMIAFGASMFHLFNHAMAKGMLFMASGSVIHEVHHAHDHTSEGNHNHNFDPQDMRNMVVGCEDANYCNSDDVWFYVNHRRSSHRWFLV